MKGILSNIGVALVALFALFISGVNTFAQDDGATLLLKSDSGDVYKGADDKYYISNDLGVYVEAIDRNGDEMGVGVAQIEVKVDDGEFIKYFKNRTDRIFFGASGEHTMSYRVTDRLGNMTKDQSLVIVIDSTNPTVKLEYKVTDEKKTVFKKDNFIYIPKENSITLTATDTVSGLKKVLVSKDAKDYEEVESGSEFTLSNGGVNIVKAKSVDNVLNESSLLIYNFYVDDVKPSIEIKTKYALVDELPAGNNTADTNAEEVIADDEAKEEVVAPNKKLKKGKSEKSDGIERALPVEEIGLSDAVILPGASDVSSKKYTNKNNVLNFIVNDSESGLVKVEWKLNDSEWKAYDNEPVSFDKAGSNTIEIRAVDAVGNVNSRTVTIVVDDLAPEIRLKVIKDKK